MRLKLIGECRSYDVPGDFTFETATALIRVLDEAKAVGFNPTLRDNDPAGPVYEFNDGGEWVVADPESV